MEKTLEVRWFFQGMPSSIVQRWFRLQCPGKLFETQTRTDWYAHRPRECLDQLTKLKKFSSWELEPDGINLKLRQSKLELKLRQQHFGVQQFSYPRPLCVGKVEQWCKLSEQELTESMPNHLSHNFDWIGVKKDRKQKVTQGVKSELTWLTIDSNNTIIHSSDRWWTIAFEMTQNLDSSQPDNCFNQVVETACKTYFGPQLSVNNSYGYSHWLLELLS